MRIHGEWDTSVVTSVCKRRKLCQRFAVRISGKLRLRLCNRIHWTVLPTELDCASFYDTARNAAVVRKRTTARYMPIAVAIHYLNVGHSGKSRSRSAKKQRLQRLPHICHSVKYERSTPNYPVFYILQRLSYFRYRQS